MLSHFSMTKDESVPNCAGEIGSIEQVYYSMQPASASTVGTVGAEGKFRHSLRGVPCCTAALRPLLSADLRNQTPSLSPRYPRKRGGYRHANDDGVVARHAMCRNAARISCLPHPRMNALTVPRTRAPSLQTMTLTDAALRASRSSNDHTH
jgi:hypothetical protein